VKRGNQPLGRKWNDGYQLAGMAGVDFCVPFGSDDWIDHRLVLAELECGGEYRCHRLSAVVSEDGRRLSVLRIPYDGGDGMRMIPAELLRKVGWRPAEEDKPRAIDTSVLRRLTTALGRPPRMAYIEVHELQIVDWKSRVQLNSYEACCKYRVRDEMDPWVALAEHYPADALREMRQLYGLPVEVAA